MLADGAEVVANMGLAAGLDAGEDTFHGGGLGGANWIHVDLDIRVHYIYFWQFF